MKLTDAIKVSDGSRVIVTILGSNTKSEDKFLSEELENEDVEFVRACRGRLAKQLRYGSVVTMLSNSKLCL